MDQTWRLAPAYILALVHIQICRLIQKRWYSSDWASRVFANWWPTFDSLNKCWNQNLTVKSITAIPKDVRHEIAWINTRSFWINTSNLTLVVVDKLFGMLFQQINGFCLVHWIHLWTNLSVVAFSKGGKFAHCSNISDQLGQLRNQSLILKERSCGQHIQKTYCVNWAIHFGICVVRTVRIVFIVGFNCHCSVSGTIARVLFGAPGINWRLLVHWTWTDAF